MEYRFGDIDCCISSFWKDRDNEIVSLTQVFSVTERAQRERSNYILVSRPMVSEETATVLGETQIVDENVISADVMFPVPGEKHIRVPFVDRRPTEKIVPVILPLRRNYIISVSLIRVPCLVTVDFGFIRAKTPIPRYISFFSIENVVNGSEVLAQRSDPRLTKINLVTRGSQVISWNP